MAAFQAPLPFGMVRNCTTISHKQSLGHCLLGAGVRDRRRQSDGLAGASNRQNPGNHEQQPQQANLTILALILVSLHCGLLLSLFAPDARKRTDVVSLSIIVCTTVFATRCQEPQHEKMRQH